MRLTKYRVTHFRSVLDSGWITVDQVVALIGVNESGKTNLLLPLWKLNPAREGEISPTSDYPKGNFAAIRENPAAYDFIEAEFEVGDLSEQLMELTGLTVDDVACVRAKKNFAGQLSFAFPSHMPRPRIPLDEVKNEINACRVEIDGIKPLAKEESIKPDILAQLAAVSDSTGEDQTSKSLRMV